MQDSLTFLYDLVLGTGATYVGVGFILGVIDLWQKCSPDYAQTAIESTAAQPISLPASTATELNPVAIDDLTVDDDEPELEMIELEQIELEQMEEREQGLG